MDDDGDVLVCQALEQTADARPHPVRERSIQIEHRRAHACCGSRPLCRKAANRRHVLAVFPAELSCERRGPAGRFALPFVVAAQVADGADAEPREDVLVAGSEVTEDARPENFPPTDRASGGRVAADVAKIHGTFERDETGRQRACGVDGRVQSRFTCDTKTASVAQVD